MATVQDWVDSIRLDVPEPLDATVARQVRYAIQKFFNDSEAWQHKEVLDVKKGEVEFYLNETPRNTYILAGDYCYFTPEGADRYKLASTLTNRIEDTMGGSPTFFAVDSEKIYIDGGDVTGKLTVGVKVQVTERIDAVPRDLANKWFDDIRHGAMARLLTVPDKSWTDPKSAATHEGMFAEGILRAKREVRNDRSRPKRTIRFNKGFSW